MEDRKCCRRVLLGMALAFLFFAALWGGIFYLVLSFGDQAMDWFDIFLCAGLGVAVAGLFFILILDSLPRQ